MTMVLQFFQRRFVASPVESAFPEGNFCRQDCEILFDIEIK